MQPEQQGPIQPIPEDRPTSINDIVNKQDPTPQPTPITKEVPKVVSLLPTDQQFQIFVSGDSNVPGGIIRENPIDTFSEVLKYCPDCSASQARDFLEATQGKILPSQVEFTDFDIKNIVAGFEGGGINQNFEVDTITTPSELKAEEQKSACTTCSLFGLNCDICRAKALTV